ncbi:unnamed protein product [Brassica oleracea]
MCLRTQNPYMASHLSLLLLITLSSVVSKTFWADVAALKESSRTRWTLNR